MSISIPTGSGCCPFWSRPTCPAWPRRRGWKPMVRLCWKNWVNFWPCWTVRRNSLASSCGRGPHTVPGDWCRKISRPYSTISVNFLWKFAGRNSTLRGGTRCWRWLWRESRRDFVRRKTRTPNTYKYNFFPNRKKKWTPFLFSRMNEPMNQVVFNIKNQIWPNRYRSFTWHSNDFETWPGKRWRPYGLSVNFLYQQI